MNPVRNSIAVNAEATTPVGNGVRFAIKRYFADSSLVVVLLNPSRPLAVARLVMAIAVYPLNRVLGGWARPHVLHKGGKRVEPAVANINASLSIAGMGSDTAAFAHGSPDVVFGQLAHSVLGKASRSLVALKASTAFGVSVVQLVCRNAANLAALAFTNPFANVSARIGRAFNGRQATKLQSCEINFGWHTQTV